jgi:hypothetical protein
MDDAMVLLTAIMTAVNDDDVIRDWSVWRMGIGKETTQFLDNCKNCGRVMWIAKWERQNGKNGGQYCSRKCKDEAQRKVEKEVLATPITKIEIEDNYWGTQNI